MNLYGNYSDGSTDSLMHSGVQPWSAGDDFPYVVYLREYYSNDHELKSKVWVVSYAGVPLVDVPGGYERAEQLVQLFKRAGARTPKQARDELLSEWARGPNPTIQARINWKEN